MWFVILFVIATLFILYLKCIYSTPAKGVVEPYVHFADWDDTNEILTMPITPGNPAVNNLQESLSTGTARFCQSCDDEKYKHQKPCSPNPEPFLGYNQPCDSCVDKIKEYPQKLLDRITVRQPFFFEEPDLKDYYGCTYYNDFRYPERPIPIIFAKDPVGYCAKYPYRYPCPIRYSRLDLK